MHYTNPTVSFKSAEIYQLNNLQAEVTFKTCKTEKSQETNFPNHCDQPTRAI